MKKLIYLLSAIFTLSLFGVGVIYANANIDVSTEIFAPTTYLEFYDLDSPRDYCFNENKKTHVISEAKRIVVYKDNLFSVYDMSEYNVTQIKFFDDNHLLMLSDGMIYVIELDTFTVKKTEIVANSFDVYEDYIVTSIGNSFNLMIAAIDEADGFTVTKNTYYPEDRNYSALSMINETEWLCVAEGTLFKFNSSGKGSFTQIANNLKDARYGCFSDGIYYLSRPNGIYSVDVEGINGEIGATKLLKASSNEQRLGNVVSPQGLAVYNGMLYVTDSSLNSVAEFDPVKNEFTGFYVTSRADGAGRVSSYTEDMQTYGETIYALDKNTVKTFNENGSAVLSLPLSGNYTSISVIDNIALITNGNAIYAVNLSGGNNKEPTLINIEANLAGFTSVTAITSFSTDFYFINNTIIDSNPYTEVYRMSSENFKEAVLIKRLQGRGDDICADIFGKLYILVYKNSTYSVTSFYDAEEFSSETSATEVFNISSEYNEIKSIVTDFECNVYALLNDNEIARIDEDLVATYYTISVSANLPKNAEAKDLAIIAATNNAYALFDGFILKLNPDDLNVASPSQMSIPNGYENTLEKNAFSCTLLDETRYFEVDLAKSEGLYYHYTGYSTYAGKESFVILYSDDKYTLIANDNLSCVVRTKDILKAPLNTTDNAETAYLCYNAHLYTYPVLTEYFRICEVKENQAVQVVFTTEFNGVKFALVNVDGQEGYIPYDMLKSSVAITDTPLIYKTLSAGRLGAEVFSEKELTNEIGKIDAFQTVKIYEDLGGVYKIEYNGAFGYIKSSQVSKKGVTVIRNLILISVAVIAIIVTVAFAYKRKFGKSKEES